MKCTVLTLALLAAGCGSNYIYAPESHTGAQLAGLPAADVQIPPEAPQGDVRLATFGIARISAQGQAQKIPALHLREIISNNAQQPWTVDTRDQRVTLGSRGESRAAYASAEGGNPPPVVTVPPGGKRTVDLFFPLPTDVAKAAKLPQFDAIWTVRTSSRPITERTPFERLRIEPQATYAYDWGFWGPPYWYDPVYPSGAWPGVPPVYVDRPVMIERPDAAGSQPGSTTP
jgi:hypothetical protein